MLLFTVMCLKIRFGGMCITIPNTQSETKELQILFEIGLGSVGDWELTCSKFSGGGSQIKGLTSLRK